MNDQAGGEISSANVATLGISDYLGMLRRHWFIANLIVLLAVGGAIAWVSQQDEVYESRASVLLRTGVNSQLFPAVGNNFNAFVRQPSAELEFVQSDVFREAAPTQAGVRASAPDLSNQLVFTASAATPELARDAANSWAQTYVEVRHERDLTENTTSLEDAELILDGLESDRDLILAPLAPLDDALARETESENISLLTTQRLALQQSLSDELLPVENEIRNINNELTQLRSVARFLDRPDVSAVVSRQATLGRQTAPQPLRDVGLAAVLGLFTAMAAVLLLDTARNRVAGADDLHRVAPGLPVLANIPFNRGQRRKGPMAMSSPVREGVERLLTAVGLATRNSGARVVLITSVQESEGKTSTALWLTQRAAAQGLHVLLIDADLRRPRIDQLLNINREPGLGNLATSTHLAADDVLTTAVQPDGSSFDVVTAGTAIEHPAGFLRSGDLGTLIDKLQPYYQLVVIDSPPVHPVSDAEIIAEVGADLVVLLARSNNTRRDELRRAVRKLEPLNADLLGLVLVGGKNRSSYYDE